MNDLQCKLMWIPQDSEFTAQTYVTIFYSNCFNMCHRLESMCQGQTSAFPDELDPTRGVRLHYRWVVNLEGRFGRRHPAASTLSLPTP